MSIAVIILEKLYKIVILRKKKGVITSFGGVVAQCLLYDVYSIFLTLCMVSTASDGYDPLAVSPDNMTQSAPSNTALATSEASALVGRGLSVIDSNI